MWLFTSTYAQLPIATLVCYLMFSRTPKSVFLDLFFRGYNAIIARHSTYCVVDACLNNWFKHAVDSNTLFYLEYPIYRSCKVLKFMLEKMKHMFCLFLWLMKALLLNNCRVEEPCGETSKLFKKICWHFGNLHGASVGALQRYFVGQD